MATFQGWIATNSELSWISILLVGFESVSVMSTLLRRVVEDVTQGSPYGTGTLNALTPEFKRIASIQGDILFQGPRRFLLEHRAHKQNAWSFGMASSHIPIYPYVSRFFSPVSNATKSVPDLGSVCDDFCPFPRPLDPLTRDFRHMAPT